MSDMHYVAYDPVDGLDFAVWMERQLRSAEQAVGTLVADLHLQGTDEFAITAEESLQTCCVKILWIPVRASGLTFGS
jgi:hypothetical protein